MKILYLLDRPNLYGSEQHLLRLVTLLKGQHELSVLVFNEGLLIDLLRTGGIEVAQMNMGWLSFTKLNKLSNYLKKGNFDLVHAHQPKALFWGSIVSKLAKIPCIITVHSLPASNIQSYSNILRKSVVGTFHYFVKGMAELLAAKVIYLSKFSFKYAWFKQKSIVIPNWVDKLVDESKLKQNFKKEPRFVAVGSVTYNKGMDRMISALALIKDRVWTINIAGSYEQAYKLQLERQAQELGIADRITYLGHTNNLESLLLSADGFILLSRGETFGLVYIEAMNCGLPVISWNIPVVKEIIPEGNLILEKATDIRQVFPKFYNSQSDFRKLSLINHAFVAANFTAAHVEATYLKLYAEVLSDHRD